jgi:hypothetical protein
MMALIWTRLVPYHNIRPKVRPKTLCTERANVYGASHVLSRWSPLAEACAEREKLLSRSGACGHLQKCRTLMTQCPRMAK